MGPDGLQARSGHRQDPPRWPTGWSPPTRSRSASANLSSDRRSRHWKRSTRPGSTQPGD